jgi:hypothetical protein
MNVRYRVELSQAERGELGALLSGGKHGARKLKRAQILLAADAGVGDEEIARGVGVGGSTVSRTKRRFVLGNLEAALSEEPRAGAARKLSGKEEALLVATACSKPDLAQKLIQPWKRFADKTATNNSCLFELSVSCCCDLSALQEFGTLCHSREEIADRDDPLRRGGCAGSVTANSLRCATLVAMVQTADLWEGDNGTCRRRLHGPRLWAILG